MQTVSQVSISHQAAQQLVSQAVDVAEAMGIAVSTCVVDIHGRVKAKITMDGAPVIADELVEKKAKTALLGLSSASFAEAVAGLQDIQHSMLQLEQITLLGGGYPLLVDGRLVGGFAVGGGTVEQDCQCAERVLNP